MPTGKIFWLTRRKPAPPQLKVQRRESGAPPVPGATSRSAIEKGTGPAVELNQPRGLSAAETPGDE